LGGIFSAPGAHDLGNLNSLQLSDFDPVVRNSLSTFDKFFNSFLDEAKRSARQNPLISPFYISEKDGNVIVEVQVAPGTGLEHITVTPRGDLLTINVQKTEVIEGDEGSYTTHIEWSRESFTRTGLLPGDAQAGGMTTDYKDQILRMVFPKNE
jgi:HSP20 family molecular chaperone IbpA